MGEEARLFWGGDQIYPPPGRPNLSELAIWDTADPCTLLLGSAKPFPRFGAVLN